MIRVGIVGCGKVADKHASQIRRIEGSEIVGLCDQERLMASQLAERLGVRAHFSDVEMLLSDCRPDVVHITTPPGSHFALAKQCLEAGCHVYVEKPFTLSSGEAEVLLSLAEVNGRKITVGHETQFMPVAMQLRRAIGAGYLGGPPVHLESIYCYEFGDERYAKALLGDRKHWIRRLPGGLIQNIISHGIGKIVEYLTGDKVVVLAEGFTSAFLEQIGEPNIIDELRVIVIDNNHTTAYFTFSSQMSPCVHQFRVFGPKNSLVADYEHQTLMRMPKQGYKSYLKQFIPPFLDARQDFSNGCLNIKRFLRNELHAESGMFLLLKSFYESVVHDTPPPIPHRDILLCGQIMDEIFRQIGRREETGVVAQRSP